MMRDGLLRRLGRAMTRRSGDERGLTDEIVQWFWLGDRAGGYTIRGMAVELDKRKVPTPRGGS
jgi:hypothetical protein